ncbi:MAG: hypothetical protein WCF33_19450 [Pseudonocardiaceae bacterium]
MSPPSERGGGVPLLRDIDGTPVAFHRQVEQVAVDAVGEGPGALFSRLHQRGEVLGWDTHLLYVRLERDGHTVALRPDLVRVLTTDGG